MKLVSVDCAFKDLATSDFVAISVIGIKGRKRFVLNVVNKHSDAAATEAEIRRQREVHRPLCVVNNRLITYTDRWIYAYMTRNSMSEPETTRLTITWSKEADHALRTFLGSQGMKKGDLSKFIEEVVRWRIFHQTVREAREAFADVSPHELQKMIDEAVEDARAKHLSFAKILWCREINSLYSFLNPCICYNLGHVPLLATLIRSLGSPLSPPWQFAAGEPRPSATGLCPETKESTTEVDRNG